MTTSRSEARPPFRSLLVANRGEIACRVIRSARAMGIETIAVHSEADHDAVHVAMADRAVEIGPAPAAQSYIDIDRVMRAIEESGAEAVHPGYGFLSENPKFARALADRGVAFVGPPVGAIEAMGDKIASKKIAAEAGVSTVPGHMGLIADAEEAVRIAHEIGYPVMIKASAGGGGKGMRIAHDDTQAREGFEASKREAASSFGDDRIFIEKFVVGPRHIEIQVLADKHGNCVYLGERECSIQRRNQKVIEEAPSPFLDPETRAAMGAQACALAQAVGYESAGTVEFIVDADRNFYFLEMNTRLQVEHPVTELITGIDLVEQMIRVAAGEPLPFVQDDIKLNGWAIESRLYAEDPYRGFLPSIGRLTRYRPPQEFASEAEVVRNDTGVAEGGEISMHYDPMIAKLCTWAPDRERAVDAMERALDGFELEGIGHNLPFLSAAMAHPKFRSGEIHTGFIAEEWPEGFSGVDLPSDTLRRIAAACATLQRIEEIRRARISGRIDHHERRVGEAFVVQVAGESHAVTLKAGEGATNVRFEDGAVLRVAGDWTPGARLARLTVEGTDTVLKVEPRIAGFRVRHRGADLDVKVWTARQAELAALMPEKQAADTSKLLLCPMPGIVVHVDVEEGQEVEEGQPLCTVEAMKMENVLRAERKLKVAKLHAAAGDSLSVDQTIMEFE